MAQLKEFIWDNSDRPTNRPADQTSEIASPNKIETKKSFWKKNVHKYMNKKNPFQSLSSAERVLAIIKQNIYDNDSICPKSSHEN